MNRRQWFGTMLVTLMGSMLLGSVCLGADDDAAALRERFKKRLTALNKARDDQKVGESALGYVQAVKKDFLEDKELKKLVEEENADRKKLYELLKSPDATAEVVGKRNGLRNFRNAKATHYLQTEKGEWILKKDWKDTGK